MTQVTELEIKVLAELAVSNFRGGDDLTEPVWAFSANPNLDKQSFGGVVSSLVKKGLVEHWDDEPEATRRGQDSRVLCFTKKGIETLALSKI